MDLSCHSSWGKGLSGALAGHVMSAGEGAGMPDLAGRSAIRRLGARAGRFPGEQSCRQVLQSGHL
jgi:hypothetical protein